MSWDLGQLAFVLATVEVNAFLAFDAFKRRALGAPRVSHAKFRADLARQLLHNHLLADLPDANTGMHGQHGTAVAGVGDVGGGASVPRPPKMGGRDIRGVGSGNRGEAQSFGVGSELAAKRAKMAQRKSGGGENNAGTAVTAANTAANTGGGARRRSSKPVAGSGEHELLTAPTYSGKFLLGQWTRVSTKYNQHKCSAPGCTRKIRTYCSCDPMSFLCQRCFVVHFTERTAAASAAATAAAPGSSTTDATSATAGNHEDSALSSSKKQQQQQQQATEERSRPEGADSSEARGDEAHGGNNADSSIGRPDTEASAADERKGLSENGVQSEAAASNEKRAQSKSNEPPESSTK